MSPERRRSSPAAGGRSCCRSVVATLYDSMMAAHAVVLGPLDAATADRVYREFGVLGSTLQVPEGLWPADREAFAAYVEAMNAELRVHESALETARRLLHAESAPGWLRAAMPTARLVTAGLLPEPIRRAYPHLPSRLRTGPRDRLLRELAG